MATPIEPPAGSLQEKLTTLDNVQRATLNILEDFDSEKQRLEQVQRASLNILEDFGDERRRLEGVQRAAINILEDFDEEKRMLQGVQRATLNILEDFNAEKTLLEDSQRALLNILEDIDVEKAKVATVNQQLETANKELEAFSYSVSHDLRAPLRSIDGFSLALLEDYGDKLDNEGRDYLERVRGATQHMAQLIDDMLNLSRVTRSEMRHEIAHLSAMAREIGEGLRKTQPEREVEFIIAENVTATGDERLLRVVMQNLLGNAWKYTGKHARARIEFGVKDEGGKPVFYVRDDGAGFNIAYADKLFGVFQRLHRRGEFPGTGVGLAICRKIVESHWGTITGKSAVGQGAAFIVTLPTVQPIALPIILPTVQAQKGAGS